MKQFTKARAAIERQYKTIQREILEERNNCCQGCGGHGRITFSHRIPRSRRRDLIADKENIDLMCMRCHELVELGAYDQLDNGSEIAAYIERIDQEYFFIKTFKMTMKNHVGEYDKTEAFLAAVKLLEIEGNNKLIRDIQSGVFKSLKEKYEGGIGVDWLIMLVIEARKDVRKELSNQK